MDPHGVLKEETDVNIPMVPMIILWCAALMLGFIPTETHVPPLEKPLAPMAEEKSPGKSTTKNPVDKDWFDRSDAHLARVDEVLRRFQYTFPEYSEYDPEEGRQLLRDLDALQAAIEGTKPPDGPAELTTFAAGLHEVLSERLNKVRYMIQHYMSGDWRAAQKAREEWKRDHRLERWVKDYHQMRDRYLSKGSL
ncbi:hypothetical protein SAMN04488112_10269 [Melghirimyces thermohalophilus]|uniref:Uncharacterized protein n=1 Tax=Melghirimyces thermohalophilus TaxID=1236220 RepID=A0A1G6I639_9BACL|nr:hypothetical protein [Melghirimyces thermohalophilus]SDC01823.1 hypothetical protein SAMN04488112_10269 [Melghirimyces thermohalophilus]